MNDREVAYFTYHAENVSRGYLTVMQIEHWIP